LLFAPELSRFSRRGNKDLINPNRPANFLRAGVVAEWLKAPVC
jgi:hypothetical protein